MSARWADAGWIAVLGGAGLLLLLDLGLSVALESAATLSRVALRRMSTEAPRRLAFLEEMKRPASCYRAAAAILRQLCLLGVVLLSVWIASVAGWALPVVGGVALGALLGVLIVEALVARSIALWKPRRALRLTAFLVRFARLLLYPVVEPLHRLALRLERRTPGNSEEREEEQDEEVEALIEVGEREGLLEAEEGEMMRGIVDLDETVVREIMTPRTDIVALPVETSVADARGTLLQAGHSRLPVFRGSIDNVVGVLHARDLFQAWEADGEAESISRYLRPAAFVPETLSAAELLGEMRQKTHLALVVDEYGGTAGLVTLEDLLEEIVGEIRDEHESEEELMVQESDGSWTINAVAHVKELESRFGFEMEDRDFDTVGGLVVFGFGRVPSPGERLEFQGLSVEVLQADRRRVHKVRVRKLDEPDRARRLSS
jgi:CBS domain containing-hemolysin-like protein